LWISVFRSCRRARPHAPGPARSAHRPDDLYWWRGPGERGAPSISSSIAPLDLTTRPTGRCCGVGLMHFPPLGVLSFTILVCPIDPPASGAEPQTWACQPAVRLGKQRACINRNLCSWRKAAEYVTH